MEIQYCTEQNVINPVLSKEIGVHGEPILASYLELLLV
jgi:hypothetical protein